MNQKEYVKKRLIELHDELYSMSSMGERLSKVVAVVSGTLAEDDNQEEYLFYIMEKYNKPFSLERTSALTDIMESAIKDIDQYNSTVSDILRIALNLSQENGEDFIRMLADIHGFCVFELEKIQFRNKLLISNFFKMDNWSFI